MDRKPTVIPNIGGWGNHEYGNWVGIFRVLSVLDKHGITPTLGLAVAPDREAEGLRGGAHSSIKAKFVEFRARNYAKIMLETNTVVLAIQLIISYLTF